MKRILPLYQWQIALALLEDGDHLAIIARKMVGVEGCMGTTSSIHHMICHLFDKGFINCKKEGRTKILSVTTKGQELRTNCRTMCRLLNVQLGQTKSWEQTGEA